MAMVSERSAALPAPGTSAIPERSALLFLALFSGFAVVAASLYGSVLTAAFVSDDYGYIVSHPDTESRDSESVREIFDPWGMAKLYTANYAPVHLFLTSGEREPFGDATLGYHIVNVTLHTLVGVLFVVWLWQLGVGRVASVAAGLVCVIHPVNIEAVA
jgi:fatty acid desaturase